MKSCLYNIVRMILVVLCLIKVSGSFAAVPLDRVVAIVNDQVVTQGQLNREMEAAKQHLLKSGEPAISDSELQKQCLEKLISQSLELQIAKRAKLTISDAELNSAIGKIAASNHLTIPQLYEALAHENMNEKQFRDQIRDQMIIGRVQSGAVGKSVHVTDQEIKDFLKALPKQTADDAEYHLADIVVALNESPSPEQLNAAKKKAEELVQQLKGGADFSKLAMTNSNGAEAIQGGELGWRRLNELPDMFVASVKTLKVGSYTAPIQAPNGFHILKLLEIKTNEKHLTEAEAKEVIFQRKFQDQLQIWLNHARKSAYIKVML